MNDKLKPCPFCGGEKIKVQTDDDDKFDIYCHRCGVSVDGLHSEEGTIDAWNSRPIEDATRQAALEKAIERIRGMKLAHERILDKNHREANAILIRGIDTAIIAVEGLMEPSNG